VDLLPLRGALGSPQEKNKVPLARTSNLVLASDKFSIKSCLFYINYTIDLREKLKQAFFLT
jgi:hypothetical protein